MQISDKMRLTIIGSASATPCRNRYPSAQILQCGKLIFLIDCGEGTLFRLIHHHIKIHKITHICISHLHPDHYLGIFNLIFNWIMEARTTPLYIIAPAPLQAIIDNQLSLNDAKLPFLIHFIPIIDTAPHVFFDDDALQIQTLPLHHSVPCVGYVFMQKTTLRRYAYLTDTTPQPQYHALLNGVNLLYHEATYLHEALPKAIKYHHSTAQQAAEIAQIYNAQNLIIGHFSARYQDLEPLLHEAKNTFENTQLATEGSQWEI